MSVLLPWKSPKQTCQHYSALNRKKKKKINVIRILDRESATFEEISNLFEKKNCGAGTVDSYQSNHYRPFAASRQLKGLASLEKETIGLPAYQEN